MISCYSFLYGFHQRKSLHTWIVILNSYFFFNYISFSRSACARRCFRKDEKKNKTTSVYSLIVLKTTWIFSLQTRAILVIFSQNIHQWLFFSSKLYLKVELTWLRGPVIYKIKNRMCFSIICLWSSPAIGYLSLTFAISIGKYEKRALNFTSMCGILK